MNTTPNSIRFFEGNSGTGGMFSVNSLGMGGNSATDIAIGLIALVCFGLILRAVWDYAYKKGGVNEASRILDEIHRAAAKRAISEEMDAGSSKTEPGAQVTPPLAPLPPLPPKKQADVAGAKAVSVDSTLVSIANETLDYDDDHLHRDPLEVIAPAERLLTEDEALQEVLDMEFARLEREGDLMNRQDNDLVFLDPLSHGV